MHRPILPDLSRGAEVPSRLGNLLLFLTHAGNPRIPLGLLPIPPDLVHPRHDALQPLRRGSLRDLQGNPHLPDGKAFNLAEHSRGLPLIQPEQSLPRPALHPGGFSAVEQGETRRAGAETPGRPVLLPGLLPAVPRVAELADEHNVPAHRDQGFLVRCECFRRDSPVEFLHLLRWAAAEGADQHQGDHDL